MAQAFTDFSGSHGLPNQPTSFVASDGFVGPPVQPFNPNNPVFGPAMMPNGSAYASASIPATGSTQLTANLLTGGGITSVASATAGTQFGLILPNNTQGSDTIVINPTGVAIAVYPAVGGSIAGQAVNVPLYVPANSMAEFFAAGNNTWSVQLSLPNTANIAVTTSASTASFTATGPNIASATDETDFMLTGTLAGAANVTLPTVATLVTQLQQLGIVPSAGSSYKLRIVNASAGAFAWTVVTNTGWTLVNTMSIAQNTWRDFVVSFTSATAVTLTSTSTGTYS